MSTRTANYGRSFSCSHWQRRWHVAGLRRTTGEDSGRREELEKGKGKGKEEGGGKQGLNGHSRRQRSIALELMSSQYDYQRCQWISLGVSSIFRVYTRPWQCLTSAAGLPLLICPDCHCLMMLVCFLLLMMRMRRLLVFWHPTVRCYHRPYTCPLL